MNRKIRQIICVILSLICVVSIWYKPVLANEKSSNYSDIDSRLKKEIRELHIPGMAIAIVNYKEVLFSETYGNCDNLDTPFIIGSLSKSFTALAVMQLVEEEKVDLDTKISDYIDTSAYFINASDGDRITIRQLLNQTSGLGTYQRFGNAKITESYGQHQYANINYGLLGEIIEAVSGISYSEYMDKNIFSPLSMSHTAATLIQSKENGLITGYRNYFGLPIAGEPDYPDKYSWSKIGRAHV